MNIENFLVSKKSEMINFTQSLVRINSVHGNETAVCNLVKKRFERYGIKSKFLGKDKRRQSLVCVIKGRKSKKSLLLAGHVDTVPFCNNSKWKYPPLSGRLVKNKIYGRGSHDMKSGIAAMVYATIALYKLRNTLNGNVIFAFTSDEEGGFHSGIKSIMRAGIKADACVITEPTSKSQLTIGARGVYRFEITTIGRTGHTGLASSKGINAITKMAKVLLALQKTKFRYKPMKGFPKPKITAGTLIKGGVGINVYPPECSALFDSRLSYGQTKKSVKEDIAKILKNLRRLDTQLKYKIRDITFSPPAYTSIEQPIAKVCLEQIGKIYNKKPKTNISGGTSDGNIVASYGIPCVTFGTIGDNAHTEDEFSYASSIPLTAVVYVRVALEFLGG